MQDLAGSKVEVEKNRSQLRNSLHILPNKGPVRRGKLEVYLLSLSIYSRMVGTAPAWHLRAIRGAIVLVYTGVNQGHWPATICKSR